MKKTWKRLLCLWLACNALAFSACEFPLFLSKESESGSVEESSSVAEETAEEISSEEEEEEEETSEEEESSDEQTEEEEEREEPVFPTPTLPDEPNAPDETKTLLKTETDAIGHKIAYYTDGTFEDLGRETPLDFSPAPAAEQYGYQYFEGLPEGEGLCDFYEAMYTLVSEFAASGKTVQPTGEDYRLSPLDYGACNLTTMQAVSVWKIFRMEYPEYYFIHNVVKYSEENKKMYLLVSEEYASGQVRAQLQEGIEAAAYDCDKFLSGLTTETERALTIYEYLTHTLDYAYEADGVTPEDAAWAHNLVGTTRGEGVCETYAKAFDFYCRLFGLESLLVVGDGVQGDERGGHAWNIVKLNGAWYNIDATWGDQAYIWREWFCTGASEFAVYHETQLPTSEWGVEYQYEIPQTSEDEISPVLLRENDGAWEWLPHIDKAFEKMQNEGSRYEVNLSPDTTVSRLSTPVRIAKTPLTATMPKVKKLILSGATELVETASGTRQVQPELTLVSTYALNAPLVLENVTLLGELEQGAYTLTLLGNAAVKREE